jgi:hypothetical protein
VSFPSAAAEESSYFNILDPRLRGDDIKEGERMKVIKISLIFIIIFASFLVHCGSTSSSSTGGTETGTTDSGTDTVNVTTLSVTLEAVATTLVPDIASSSSSSSLSSSFALTYADSDDFSNFLEDDSSYVITDVFGAADESPAVVTKIRVLLDSFASNLEDLFANDSEFSCTSGDSLDEGDTIDVAFFGELENGTSDDRYFECIIDVNDETILYGQDSSGTVRVVAMSENTAVNEEQTDTRGDTTSFHQVVFATYGESSSSTTDDTAGYLDLQYVQATVYSGVDDEFGTSDDVVFKSRSRITGTAEVDDSGSVTSGTGDFVVTKYDEGVNDDDSTYTNITQTMGRGSYGDGEVSLFSINTDVSDTLEDSSGTYCIEHSATDFPSTVDSTECEALETDYAWTDADFPFTLSPTISADYETNEFFAGDDTDLISNSGDNFTIPTYTVTE